MDQLIIDNPYTGETVVERTAADEPAVDAMLAAAVDFSRTLAAMPIEDRVAKCRTALQTMLDDRDRIAADIARMMGKPEGQAHNEIRGLEERAQHMLDIAATSLEDTVLPEKEGLERRIERVPHGVVFNMPAWNYPLLTCVNVVFPAVAAGNAVILKHSARSALCGEHFADAFAQAFGTRAAVGALHCSHAMAARVAGDRRVGFVAFTGSVRGGHAIYQAVANHHFADVGLELGGKDPAYVAEDADIPAAVAGLVDGACYNAGQSCCGVERVYVHEKVYDDFVAGARAEMAKLNLGDPTAEVDMGPMAQPHAPAFLKEQVDEALAKGAERLFGTDPGPIEGRGRFFFPTLLTGVDHSMNVMREESFGPIMPVVKVATDREAVTLANDSNLGLTASIWSTDRDRAARLARQLQTGTVYLNRCDVLDPALPWTGVKDTGKGSTLSSLGYLHVTRPRAWNFRLP
ncbi:MAG: aldehyde dehydrogenase family protein [Actinomycetota bacterium]